jgi:hypothetical protein
MHVAVHQQKERIKKRQKTNKPEKTKFLVKTNTYLNTKQYDLILLSSKEQHFNLFLYRDCSRPRRSFGFGDKFSNKHVNKNNKES